MPSLPDKQLYDIEEDDWEKESQMLQAASAADILKDLGPMSQEECDYYMNLK